jgi:aminoglycoside 6'-N-acetyltransferase I
VRFVSPVDPEDSAWLQLRCALWPHVARAEHVADLARSLGLGHFACLAYAGPNAIGLVEASIRNDYVNGTESSPVAFLEGLYVTESHRRTGVARALVRQVQNWVRAKGLRELASDSPLDNTVAHAVHRALGFVETERVVYFRISVPAA